MKIKTLTLDNFRAFPGPEPQTFNLDGKNLLVYGENGSGKSSVFHALKTFFTLTPPNSVGETCNVFSGIPDHWIEVEFDDGHKVKWTGPPAPQPWTGDAHIVSAALRRGCLDYRALLDTNYGHGDGTINLFWIAISALLGDYSVPTRGGGTTTIAELWNNVTRVNPYYRFVSNVARVREACLSFNQGFNLALAAIKPEVDALLEKLPVEGMRLDALNFPGTTHNYDKRSIDGTELLPLTSWREYAIDRPQHFLNEAKLSALGLAIYLAGRLTCVPRGGNDLKLLVLDDVLIGIDLSNRLPLLDLLRERFNEWQIVLLTHDRVWFEMARLHIQGAGKWNCLEIYDRICAERSIPYPIIRKVNDKAARGCLEDARKFLGDGYEPAAANYTRSAFELALKVFCERFAVPVRYKLEARHVTSEDYLGAVETWLRDKQKPFLDASLERVKMFRSVVLNQGSHSAPPNIARSEIEGAISAIDDLLKLTEARSDADAEANALDKATELANGATNEERIASLGYVRGALAVKLRKFCKDKKVAIAFDDISVKTLWKAVHDNHTHRFTGASASVPADVEGDKIWFVDPITDAQLQSVTQAHLQRLIGILSRWP